MTTGVKIAANIRSLGRQVTGVERYTAEVTRRLKNRLRLVAPVRQVPAAAGQAWEQLRLPFEVGKHELLWSPANTGPLAVTNQVLTLHDTKVIEHPEWYRPLYAYWYRLLLAHLLPRISRIITVSEHSRQRILKLFSLEANRVRVIYPGVNKEQFKPASQDEISRMRSKYGLTNRYMLYLGTLEPGKNLGLLLRAWRLIQLEFASVELVIAGGHVNTFAADPYRLDQKAVRWIQYPPDADLSALYSGAELFVLPSRSEGFGLAVLEAMACGAPILAARAAALPEVIGNAGLLEDPLKIDDWVAGIRFFLSDADIQHEYRQRGLEHVRDYSWDKTAADIWSELVTTSQAG